MKKILATAVTVVLSVSLLAGCGSNAYTGGNNNTLSRKDALSELDTLTKKLDVETVENPTMDIYTDDSTETALADIKTFKKTVRGDGDINVEIAAPSELSGKAPDDWINVMAKDFNKQHKTIGGKTVSVTIRSISSGETLTYMTEGDYRPEAYIPSNEIFGSMLKGYDIDAEQVTDRLVGNTAGILMKQDVYKDFTGKYKKVTVKNVLTAANNGDLTFAYTNPYTSATGMNALTAMLYAFDEKDPLSGKAVKALNTYQKTSPPVAYTTAVLRNQAEKGIVDAMVMEEQAYINSSELKGYEYVPFGVRHDHPVYTFDWDSAKEKQAVKLFVNYCKSSEAQELASSKGFNRHDSYQSQKTGLNGTQYISAQKVWKENKTGSQPIIAVFIADTSGSMSGKPLKSLQKSLISASKYIGRDNYVGLVSYGSDVTINLPIQKFTGKQQAYFIGETKNLYASGSTATYDAVLTGLSMIEKKMESVKNARPMLFVLTDGEQNIGYSLDRVLPIVKGLEVPVYSIAYNYSDTSDLEKLSEVNEATVIRSGSDDIINQLRNLFNVQL